jgi:hypothetical protein
MVSGTTSGLVGTSRNQIYLKLNLGATQFMPGIKNLNLNFFLILFELQPSICPMQCPSRVHAWSTARKKNKSYVELSIHFQGSPFR